MMNNSCDVQSNPPVILLMGATASGKTGLAMELYQHLPVSIINVDSVQFYRHFDIGSAKPTPAELKSYDISMIDICDPDDSYSVARFCCDVELEIQRAQLQDKVPLLTGGSMMYFRSLTHGLSSMPAADPEIRRYLQLERNNKGLIHLYRQLSQIDPKTASRLSSHDSQRITRALEVFMISGKTASEYHNVASAGKYRFIAFALSHMSRHEIHKCIEDRFYTMLQNGLVSEVEQLKLHWPNALDKPVFRAVGYRQVLNYLSNTYDYPTMIEKGLSATRQLAKRQITWLRNWPNINHLKCNNKQELVKQIVTMTGLS